MSILNVFSSALLPLMLLMFAIIMCVQKNNFFDSFAAGAREGLISVIDLLPTLVLVVLGVNMLFSSGAVDTVISLLSPVLTPLGVPKELLPNIALRPFSGSATTAIADKLFRDYGTDGEAGIAASILMGSTDTIVYTLAVYFSAVKIRKTKHAFAASFLVFIFSIFVSITMTKLFF